MSSRPPAQPVPGAITAAVFDMDGLLFDTERVGRWAWATALAQWDFPLSDDLYGEFVGRDMAWRELVLKRHFGPGLPFQEIMETRIRLGDAREMAEGLPPKPGAVALLQACRSRGLRIGLATGTARDRALRRLHQAGIQDYFSAVVTSADVPRGKPAPDIYQATLSRLDTPPTQAIAFEDASAGILSATDASLRTILIPDLEAPTPTALDRAFRCYPSLLVALEALDELLAGE